MAVELKVTWELRRKVSSEYVLYSRVSDLPTAEKGGGSAAVYGGPRKRTMLVAVNGNEYIVEWPNTGSMFVNEEGQPDSGFPVNTPLRFEPEWGWVLYAYMFSGDTNPHTEWVGVLGVGGLQ
jgi:hypothetical protein